MNLNEIKNKMVDISQSIDRLDLADGSIDLSVKNKVELGMASIYPVDNVTPHLSYLFNTRPVWIGRMVKNYGDYEFFGIPSNTIINHIYQYKNDNSNYIFNPILGNDFTRTGGILNFKFSNINVKKLDNFNMDTLTFSGPVAKYVFDNEYNQGIEVENFKIISKNAVKIKQSILPDIADDFKRQGIYKDGNYVIKVDPLRVETEQGAIVSSSNEYIDFKGIMTILIYRNRIVYIRLNGTEFKYKIFSYPNMSLLAEGSSNSLKDIYIKNKIYRDGIVGPNIWHSNEHTPVNGFILTSFRENVNVVDLYNIIGPKFCTFDLYNTITFI